jgi:hypothetical protein
MAFHDGHLITQRKRMVNADAASRSAVKMPTGLFFSAQAERTSLTALRISKSSSRPGLPRLLERSNGPTDRRIANQTGEEQALHMSTVEQIIGAVKRLPKKDLARFRKWFAEYDAAVWDRQLEQDAAAGRPDVLAREALRDYHAARTRER